MVVAVRLPCAVGPVLVPATGTGNDFLLRDLFEAVMAVTTVLGPLAAAAVAAVVAWYGRHCRGG